MAEIGALSDVLADTVPDGTTVALEGFTHLIPHAAGHELIRRDRRDLTLLRMTPDVLADQLIGAGCVERLVFSWGGNPGVGPLPRLRDAVERGWPRPLRLSEHSHAGMVAAYQAGAAGLPFGTTRADVGTDLVEVTDDLTELACPFTEQPVVAVRAHRPDVTVIHAQRADRDGAVQLWGIVGIQREAALAADRTVVTVEEIVDELSPRPGAVVLPSWTVDAVCPVPGGSHPSYAAGFSQRDNDFYRRWQAVSEDRSGFRAWLDEHVRGVADHAAHLAGLRAGAADG